MERQLRIIADGYTQLGSYITDLNVSIFAEAMSNLGLVDQMLLLLECVE